MATVRLKNRFLETFGVLVMVLALVRCVYDGIAAQDAADDTAVADTVAVPTFPKTASTRYVADGGKRTYCSVIQ